MKKRYVSIWFRHLLTDYFTLQDPQLRAVPFVLTVPMHGRMVISAANALAEVEGIFAGMVLADARAIIPALRHLDEPPGLAEKLLQRIAAWCIRFTPVAAIDLPAGIVLDASGCSHLWGGDSSYVTAMAQKFKAKGYDIRIAMAGTVGAAWALARYGTKSLVIENGEEINALLPLPPLSLRIDEETQDTLTKLGFHQIGQLIDLARESMRRRFGTGFLLRLDQALGHEQELLQAVCPPEPYAERLPCLEPIATATGIQIALERLMEQLCGRLSSEGKGARVVKFTGYCLDGRTQQIGISIQHPSRHAEHLCKLLTAKIEGMEPGLGIELFTLEASKVEDYLPGQAALWQTNQGFGDEQLAELIDRLTVRLGDGNIHRYLPAEHHWPERSVARTGSLKNATSPWPEDKLRPVWIHKPESIQVTAPVPDYPPMNFRHRGKLHIVKKADGPERIEQEWWLQTGEHRDYYIIEDEQANRYWIFRQGHYDAAKPVAWFLHGYFA